MEVRHQILSLDNLEILSMHAQAHPFPEHFHETFCISLIRSGVESIKMQDREFYCPAGNISLTNPYEVHANPIIDIDSELSFDTLYLSQDLVDYYVGEEGIAFHQRIFSEKYLLYAFNEISLQLKSLESGGNIEAYLGKFLRQLQKYALKSEGEGIVIDSPGWSELMLFIDESLRSKLSLETLANFVHMDKFHFARRFRKRVGMSPMNYVRMKRILAAKKMIQKEVELGELAFIFGFTDLAHFSKTFKRYLGVSPSSFKKQA